MSLAITQSTRSQVAAHAQKEETGVGVSASRAISACCLTSSRAPVAHRPKPPPPAIPSDVEPFKGQLAPFQEEGGGCLICAEPGGSLPKKCRECPRKAHSKCGPKKLRCPQCRYCYGCRKLLPVPNRSQQDDPAFLYSECLKCHLNWHSLCSYNIGDICPECSEPVY